MDESTIIDRVAERLERLKTDIQASMAEAGVNASGRTSQALQVVRYENGVRLIKADGENAPMETLEIGVAPLGERAPSNFAGILYDWSKDKGITFADDSERWGFSFALADRIKREGTLRHTEPVDVYSTLVSEAAEDINNIVGATIKEIIDLNF